MKHLLSFFLFLLPATNCFSQKQSVSVDTNYIQTLVDSCQTLQRSGSAKEAIILGQDVLALMEISAATADKKTQTRIKLSEATLLRVIGNAYKDGFDLPNALDYYRKCLSIAEKINDTINIAGASLNIGYVYGQLNDFEKSLDYLNKSVQLFEKIKHKRGLALCFGNLGAVYRALNQDSIAIEFYEQSLNMYNELDDKGNEATQINNIAAVYYKQKRYKESLEEYLFALKMYEEVGDSSGTAGPCAGIASIYEIFENNLTKAEKYYLRALPNADLSRQTSILNSLKDLYSKQGRYKDAFEMYDRYILAKDSIVRQQNAQEIRRKDMNAEFDEREAKLQAEKEKEAAIAAEKNKRQKTVSWSIAAGLLLVIIFSLFVLNRWRITQRQKKIIELQKVEVEKAKTEVEQKNKDITDSIRYAQRIQNALLVTEGYLQKHLPEHFVFFRPRDIVSGDFYWANLTPGHSSNGEGSRFLLLTGDCTGHGVPGAFMSLLMISLLNEIVLERKITRPDLILYYVREEIIKALNPEGREDIKDGMDCILCSFDFKNNILNAACAYNSLYLARNGELIEYEPDRIPVGVSGGEKKNFTLHEINLQKGDVIYTSTDGYADQFGGQKEKKLKSKTLREKLIAISCLSMEEQKKNLANIFDEWKGNLDQTDDVTVIGVKV